MRGFVLSLLLLVLPATVAAQDSAPAPVPAEQTARDRSYLTALLEDNLSGAGRTIRIDGFAGALSSRATFDQMTIADDEGVWLTIRDGAISWTRSALLSGRVEIDELSAAVIELPRAPQSAGGDTPSPEVKPFALPDLPVSVKIGKIEAARVVLGQALFGAAAEVSLTGSMQLEGGEGSADLSINRIDGREGRLSLTGSYANATRQLALDLLVDEARDGIAANLIGLPGTPAISLAIAGSAPIDDFTADIRLATDGAPRLTGAVTLSTLAAAGATPERRFRADLGGDISPLLPPEYRGFFGDQVTLRAEGARRPSGSLSLPVLSIDSQALDLEGAVELRPDGMPERAALRVRIGLGTGQDVLLPLAGEQTWLRGANLQIGYDRAQGDGWSLDGRIAGLRQQAMDIRGLRLTGSGRIAQRAGRALFGGTVDFAASGLRMTDPALDQAVGPFLSGRTVFSWQQGEPLRLPRLRATGRGYALNGALRVDGLDTGVTVSGGVDLRHSALGNLSGLTGRDLGGRIEGRVEGSYTVLNGAFDAELAVAGTDLRLNQPELDRLLAGRSTVTLSARRDETGITLRRAEVSARALAGTAQGVIRTGASDLTASAEMTDLSILRPGLRGTLRAEATFAEAEGTRRVTLDGTGRGLGIGQPEIDRVLAGETRLSLLALDRDGRIRLERLQLENPQLSATADGVIDQQTRRINLDARLANTALIAPGFPGPLTLSGTVTEQATAYALDLTGSGPGASRATIAGNIAQDFSRVDLAIEGAAETALANAFIAPRSVQGPLGFDLRLAGTPGLQALSGRVVASGARLVAPTLGLTLDDVDLVATLSGGQAQIDGGGRLSSGGTLGLRGPVALTAPFNGDLAVTLDRLRLRDPDLYDTRVSGSLSVTGPLAGGARIAGALDLAETELRIPSTGLGGVAAIPDITHIGETAAVRETRARAGLLDRPDEGGRRVGPAYPLDVTITAPRQIFVRGRGLDAELGGALRLGGSTADIIPIGEFSLIRGRLDILGQRFTLDEGQVAVQGALIPWIRFAATTQQDDFTTTVTIEGEASSPALRFTSTPELPEEEVLARLLFNRGLTQLSPLQAAQLASAVATLAGKGGEGIVGRLRQGFGLDDLDIGTSEEGETQLRAGKYLSENLYSDVVIDSAGKSQINLNLDVTPNLTARGSLGSDGDSGIGLFFERDY